MKKIINLKNTITFVFAYTLLFPTFTLAEEASSKNEKKAVNNSQLSVGYGVSVKKNTREESTYKNGNKNTIVDGIPLVQANYGRFSLGANGATIRIYGDVIRSVSAVLKIEGDRYEAVGMSGRKKSVFAGGLFNWGFTTFLATHDVEGRSRGWDTKLSFNRIFLISQEFIIRPSINIKWNDKNYANYYYGVKPNEATARRPAYETSGFFTPGIGSVFIFKIQNDLQLLTGLGLEYISQKVQDSPTVKNQDIVLGGFAGLNYIF